MLSLESRIMFDGASAATASKVTTEQVAQSQADASFSAETTATADTAPAAPTGEPPAAAGDQALFDALAALDASVVRQEIVFLSPSVRDYQQLLDGISPNVEVHVLDPSRDGVAQMAEILAGRTGIDAIHLIGDGTQAEMHLGASFLTQESISTSYAEQFQQIGRSLSADADLLIYGCNFGLGEAGQLAMDTLANLTGADVAASTDRTGSAAEYANWQLEVTTGSIDTSVVISASTQADWDHALATFTVTTTSNSGANSLRQAINNANAAAGTDTIVFNIAGAGLHTINMNTALPTITDRVIIDGYTQTGSSVNTLSVGNNAVLTIELDGTGSGSVNGLTLGAGSDGSTIRGLVINRFSLSGIQVNSTNNLIVGNWIGVDATGTLDRGNTVDGITISANNNTIGGSTAAERNVISGNNDEGIDIDPGISGVIIRGNYIGTNASGTAAIGNGQAAAGTWGGVLIDGNNNTLGGSNTGDGNLISGNFQYGVLINGTGNSVLGNIIGTDASGTAGVGNVGDGVRIGGSANSVGGTAVGAGNLIAFNTANGINITAGTGDALLGNQIHSNTLLGINLGAAGVTANDAGDGDAGANNLQNYPVLTSTQIVSSTQVNLVGSLNSAANSQFRIEFFSNTAQDGTGFGEGQTYLGFVNVTTDGSGNANFNTTLAATVSAGNFISATATRSNATFTTFTDTSEFAQDRVVPANTAPVLDASKSPALTAINEDAGAPVGAVGTLVSTLVDFASPAGQVDNVTDPNLGALLGLAVTAADTTNGTWFYSTNNGASWNPLGAVANANARLLAADANTRLYFQPNANYNGTLASAITFRAWDQISGSNGALADTSTNGGTTAFSTATDTASLVVNAVNDAPVLDVSRSPVLSAINEDAGAPVGAVGTLVSSLVDFAVPAGQVDNVTDVDSGALLGLAITAADTTNGTWFYSTNNGASWNALGAVANANARLLAADANTRLYFQPNANYNGTLASAITFRAWDQISGSNGALADTSTNGGTTAFSTATDTASLVVNAVNDAPTATITPLTYSATEQISLTLHGTGMSVADIDAGVASVTATVSVTSGTISVAAGTTGVTVAGSGTATVTLTGTLTQINDLLAGNLSGTLTYLNSSDTPLPSATLTLSVNDGGNTGAGGALVGSDTATINLTAVDDAPVNTVPGAQTVNEDTSLVFSSGNGNLIAISDVDAGGSSVQVTLT
ncbi:MAG TPA: DUF4347 domain-containing protein, partial [Nitrospiraceae bacterium]|nr:DUF4347 domain-containing protein [Nitrospiraceae bacterium]